jgi:L-glutamine:2-deoxy-scyllo-inosose/3-amino-2,3-dideoxy-scyllo-inosose aminotransferase
MGILAVTGGAPVRDVQKKPWPNWPVWDEDEKKGLIEVLESGIWSYMGPKERAFIEAFAQFSGSKYALAIANGTITLQLALEACDIGFGDEVIVPGLTWQATAAAVIDVNAVPILVDVEPDSWCIDPNAVEAAINKRTKAIMPVHLYGCMADMDAIMAIAKKHNLRVIEDCAHQHGSVWRGKKGGTIGDIGSFSMQLSKVMTAGEGGALTTNDDMLWAKLDALRNCGRRPEGTHTIDDKGSGTYTLEGDFIQSGNYRLSDFQAAVLLCQLKRLPGQTKLRDENNKYLISLIKDIPGIVPQKRDDRIDLQAYFNFGFSYDKDAFNGLSLEKFRWALMGELGCVVDDCYQPLNDCTLYRPHTKRRYKINDEHWKAIDPSRFSLPVCERLFKETAVTFHHKILMGPRTDMDDIAAAIRKVQAAADEYAAIMLP